MIILFCQDNNAKNQLNRYQVKEMFIKFIVIDLKINLSTF